MTVQADKKLDFEILEGSEDPIGGWISYGYAWRKPIPQLIAKHSGKAPIHFITVLAPEGTKLKLPSMVMPPRSRWLVARY